MKAYPGYKDSGVEWIGEIPEHWDIKRLKWICSFIYGNSLSSNDRVEGDIPVYGSNGITGYHNVGITEAPCIVIGRKGSYGKVNFSEKGCFPIDTTYFVDQRYTKENIHWLKYTLPTLGLDTFSRDTGVPGLSREDAYSKIISTPPKNEQQQIARYLDHKTAKIDSLIEKKTRLIELLKEERAAVINQAVTKGLDPEVPMKDSGIEWLGEVPVHWELKRLKYVADINPSNIDKKSKDDEEEIFLCNYVDVYKNELISRNLDFMKATASKSQIDKFILRKGDVLATKDSETPDDIAIPALVVENFENVVCGYHLTHMKPLKIKGEYLFRFFQSKFLQSYFEVSANGITRYGLGIDKFNSAIALIPPVEEQSAIVAHIQKETTRIDTIICKAQKEIELLKEYRIALISEVVTGKIDVREEAA